MVSQRGKSVAFDKKVNTVSGKRLLLRIAPIYTREQRKQRQFTSPRSLKGELLVGNAQDPGKTKPIRNLVYNCGISSKSHPNDATWSLLGQIPL
ncbi:hypothetical protein CUMW_279140 [Citrus unshiu]|uniref:Uncharacterized protein n=1 Tax=Citrus unshiu TaxID=55188 RepID=A0A2H5N7C4_CITUN|nr:hypothetical protein CUMW_279140 [Citrus unshiu]GAY36126.1 hypothetical protein CUMW_279140 [Citrus unshiu]GAY36128.1 hypothetical protein CUMW_279140 [Citrus unshiu]